MTNKKDSGKLKTKDDDKNLILELKFLGNRHRKYLQI